MPLIEADVHLRRDRLEVRHLKTLGPVPLLWDRWRLAPGWTPRLTLDALLEGAAGGTELMLDLKGRDSRLTARLRRELSARFAGHPVTVCSQSWDLLAELRDHAGVRAVHSIGSRRQLDRLRKRFDGQRLEGVSIHRKLLDRDAVIDLRERAAMILTWPIADPVDARRLGSWGVDGVISERFEALAAELTDSAPAVRKAA